MDIKYKQFSREELIQRIKELEYDNFALQKKLIDKTIYEVTQEKIFDIDQRLLHNKARAYDILLKTCDSLFLLNHDGVCVDCIIKADHWFLKSGQIIGQNIFTVLPKETSENLKKDFLEVITYGGTSNKNYDLPLKRNIMYFKCIIQCYDENLVLCQYRDITQRSQMKKRLDNTNRRLKETQKIAKIGHWRCNINSGVIYYSGYGNPLSTIEEDVITSIDEYIVHIHPSDKGAFYEYLTNEKPNGKHLDYRRIRIRDNFSIISYVRIQTTSVYQIKDEIIVEGYVQNIDDMIRNRWEFEIVNFMDNVVHDHIFGISVDDGRLIFGNQQFRMQNNIGETWNLNNYKLSDLKQVSTQQWNEILKNLEVKDNYKYSTSYIDKKTGEVSYFDCVSYLTKDSFGTKYIWNYWSNTTKQKYAENESKYMRNLMNTVLDNMPISIYIKNPQNDFRYIYRNKVANKIYSIQAIDFLNKTDFDLFPPEVAEKYREEDLKIIESKTPKRFSNEYIDNNGNRLIIDALKMVLLNEADNSYVIIGLGWDITELKKIEEELTEAKLKAEQLDKLKSAFLSNISHEIRTPLNAILGFSRIMAETEESDKRNYYFNFVESNNRRLLALVNEILDFSKIESGIIKFDPQNFDLGMLCLELYETYASQCEPETTLIYNNIGTELWIYSDRNRVHQILSNLIINAKKFTKKGYIDFGFDVIGKEVNIYVNDTGIGIEKDMLDKIFERFMQVDSNAIGTGLGLTICRSIVQQLGGKISATSVFGQGSSFSFTLPYEEILTKPTEEHRSEDLINTAFINKSLTILVADDDENSHQLIEAMIGKRYTLYKALNGMETIRMYEECNPDIILMDLNMPTLNGFETTNIIRQISSDIIIIAISARAYEEDIKKALDAGCNDFLAKPISIENLTKTIEKYI